MKKTIFALLLGLFLITGCVPANGCQLSPVEETYTYTNGEIPYSYFVIDEMPCVRTPYGISCDWTKWRPNAEEY